LREVCPEAEQVDSGPRSIPQSKCIWDARQLGIGLNFVHRGQVIGGFFVSQRAAEVGIWRIAEDWREQVAF